MAAWIAGKVLVPVPLAVDEAPCGFGDADIVIDLSGVTLTCDIVGGIWRLRLDESDDRNLPFARELAAGARTLEAVLYRHRAGGDEEIRRGRFAVSGSYSATLRLTLNEVASWPAIFAAALSREDLPYEAYLDRPRTAALSGIARLHFVISAPMRHVLGVLKGLVVVDQWNVGFAEGGARALLSGGPLDVRWLPDPAPGTFLADPFLVERNGVRALFVEEYDYARDRGVIDVITLDAQGRAVARERALEAPTHLSYPFPLEVDGELYLVPENAAGNEVALYRCVGFPAHWERESVLFPAFDGVDTTIFTHAGRWWAFCTRISRGSNVALYAFHASSARGPWAPHLLNPVVVDVGRARPAGRPFVVDGHLYRPGQDCANTYGGAVVISRVDQLTPLAYHESIVARVEPRGGAYCDGLHTVSIVRDTIVLDGKRTYIDLRYISRLGRFFRNRSARHRRLLGIPTGQPTLKTFR